MSRAPAAGTPESDELSKGYLSDLENGKRAGPVETLQVIAEVVGVGLDELAPRKT